MIVIDNDNDDIDSLRGLELLMYPKRKQNKLLAQRSLVKYQILLNSKPNITTERKHLALAAASTKLNVWSSLVDVETARLYVIRPCEGDYLIPIDALKQVATISPFSVLQEATTRVGAGNGRKSTGQEGGNRATMNLCRSG